MVAQNHEADAVRIDRRLPATPEEVFDAWTDPATLQQFMVPNTTRRARVKADVRVGGEFEIVMEHDDKETDHHGKYIEIDRPRKLVFTWRSINTGGRDTLVTLYFTPDGEDTRILLVHEQLPDEKAKTGHTGGWSSVLDHLTEHLQQGKTKS
jgi:uncharacterized protein YndB with AHSA1/START domain